LPFDEKEFLEKQIGGTALVGENGYSVLHRIWARPTLEVHGMPGGFSGEGAKTIIPAVAKAKISMRLVPNMQPEEIITSMKARVNELTPPGITTEIHILSASRGMVVTTENRFVRMAAQALEEVFAQQTVYVRCGGSIPVAAVMSEQLGIPVVMVGFGLPDDNTHAPNEKLNLSNFYRGIETMARYFDKLGR
jgi:acetylornithine deacetylase/succinyl-diaminopimelate desuccinylase-like protein